MMSDYSEQINDEIHDVVIFYNDIELCHDIQIDFNKFQSFYLSNHTYELRELISTTSNAQRPSKSYKSVVYNRHGGCYLNWWKQNRKGIALHSDEGSFIPFSESIFDVAVFVKVKNIDNESLRLKFLKYIGGQNKVFCEKHRLPMITSHHGTFAICCGTTENHNCKKSVSFCCPDPSCHHGLCNKCMKSFNDE